jgi:hypothetical protein
MTLTNPQKTFIASIKEKIRLAQYGVVFKTLKSCTIGASIGHQVISPTNSGRISQINSATNSGKNKLVKNLRHN